MKKKADLYKKVVYWSEEDQCFIGMCPELIHGGVHGDDALKVFIELNQAIEEAIAIFEEEGRPLPGTKSDTVRTGVVPRYRIIEYANTKSTRRI